MTIATVNELENAIDCDFTRYISNKNDPVAGQAVVGGFHSFWRSTGIPTASPIIPNATPVALSNASTGALPFIQQTSPRTSYLASFIAASSVAGVTIEIHDRLVNMGSLSGTLTTTQTITGFDVNSFLATNNIGNRIGDANYSDVQWWLEWYTTTGATNTNYTVNVTYNDGTTGDVVVPLPGGQIRISRMLPLNPLIPVADSGKYIRGVNSVTLTGTTGTTGSFGVTATRYRWSTYVPTVNKLFKKTWMDTGLPEIYNQSCLFPVCIAPATTIGNIRMNGIIAHG